MKFVANGMDHGFVARDKVESRERLLSPDSPGVIVRKVTRRECWRRMQMFGKAAFKLQILSCLVCTQLMTYNGPVQGAHFHRED